MSSRRNTRSRQPMSSSRMTDDQITDLISKLQTLLPDQAHIQSGNRVSSARVLQEICNYIRSLQREVGDLSERISELLSTADMSSAEAAIIRNLIM